MQDAKKIFTQILKGLNEKELREFISKYCKTNTAMQNKFLTHFSNKIEAKSEEKYQMIIDNSIKACSNLRGYFLIDPKKTNSALKPLYKLLEKEKVSYHQKPYESFVFARLILENFGELYESFYEVQDSDKVDNLFYETIELLNSICAADTTPYEFKEEIFEDLLVLAQEPYFNKSSSYYDAGVDLDLLRMASSLCTEEDNQQVIEIIDRKIKIKDEYDKRNFIELKIEFLKKQKLDDKLSETIDENMDQEDVRNMVIDVALQNSDIEKAIGLIKGGIELFKKKRHSGIVVKYEKKLLEVYKKNKMENEYLSLLWTLYREDFSGEFYDLLKKCYSKIEWEKELLKIINEIKREHSKESFVYGLSEKLADIYVKEKMPDELFTLIKENDYFNFLESYGKYCKDSYSSELLYMYESYINEQLGYKNTRKQYAQLADILKKLSTTYTGGKEFVGKVYRSIKQRYANKPALLEEMLILNYLETNAEKENKKTIVKEQKALF